MKMTELRRLVEEGAASGLSEQDGETFLNDVEARYRALSGAPGPLMRFRFSRQAESDITEIGDYIAAGAP